MGVLTPEPVPEGLPEPTALAVLEERRAEAALDAAEPPGLPPVPRVAGAALDPRVIYPIPDQLISVRDSNFIFGSVGSGDATLTINGAPVVVEPNGSYLGWLPVPRGTSPAYRLVVRRGADSAVLVHRIRTPASVAAAPPRPATPARPAPPPVLRAAGPVSLGASARGTVELDRTIPVRPVPNGTYKWLLLPGTVVQRVSSSNGMTRIRLDGALDGYVSDGEVVELSGSARVPSRTVANLRVVPDTGWTDVIFPLADPPPFLVEEAADRLVLTLYDTRATTDIITYRSGDSLVRTVTWEPVANDRVQYVVHLRDAPYGFHAFHDGRNFVLRVRRRPRIDVAHPLRGMIIAVDAGHPPAGSTGPSGRREAELTLPIARALEAELLRHGAHVVMTRVSDDPLGLADRPAIARRAGAHAFVSVHLNALPDGVNPFTNNGTGTYFFHPHSEPLARAVQAGMVRHLRLPDLGVFYDNLAVIRPSWMPAVLAEGAFMMLPAQEAAMATLEGQRAYARGVAEGLEAYFRSLAR
jgi:N-acetylmuramoyl-L-alanine amidase